LRIAIMLRTLDERGGISVYSANLVQALLDAGGDDHYLLLYRSAAHLGRFGSHANVHEQVLPARSKALWDQVAVPRASLKSGAHVILHPKFTVPLFSRIPAVMVLHGADWFLPGAAQFYSRLDRLYMRIFMPLYLRRAAAIISVSRLTTGDFERIFRMPPGRVRTVYFGPARHFRPVADPATLDAVRHRYGLPEPFILTLSKPDGGERKNFRGILDAYRRIHGQVPHKLVVGGKGCERFRDEYGIPAAGWGNDVVFPGWLDQSDLPAIYSACSLFLYPSNQEAFPIPFTEAMACGAPIVSSLANGLEELAGEAALLVDPADAQAIATASLDVLRDPALAERLRAAGLSRSKMFSWDSCARSTLAILRQAAQRANAATAA
jgi:glycosyltransferase involved in cell wall biosynthesis